MPKKARLDGPGVLHHIMIRGIEGRKIFVNNRGREDFLHCLSRLLPQTETACYSWVFIPNHAHFLFRTGLASLVKSLLSQAAEAYERGYELKRPGYDADRIAKRVAEIYDKEPHDFLSKDNSS